MVVKAKKISGYANLDSVIIQFFRSWLLEDEVTLLVFDFFNCELLIILLNFDQLDFFIFLFLVIVMLFDYFFEVNLMLSHSINLHYHTITAQLFCYVFAFSIFMYLASPFQSLLLLKL